MMKSFSKWTIAEVEKEFQVELQRPNDLLQTWLDCQDDLSQTQVDMLQRLQTRLIDHVL